MQGGAAGNSGSCCHRYYAGVTGFIPGPSHAWAYVHKGLDTTLYCTRTTYVSLEKKGLHVDVMQNHPLCRMFFSKCQVCWVLG